MKRWALRLALVVFGWYLTMAYPLDSSVEQLSLSVLVGTIGVAWVAVVSYIAGREDAGPVTPPADPAASAAKEEA